MMGYISIAPIAAFLTCSFKNMCLLLFRPFGNVISISKHPLGKVVTKAPESIIKEV